MTALTSLVDVVAGVVPATLGENWPVGAFQHEAALNGVQSANLVSYASPGRNKVADSPVTDADACDLARRWTAQASGVTRETDPTVLGGLPRWVGDETANAYLTARLRAPLTDYTLALLFRSTSISGHNSILNIGTVASTRLLVFHNSSGAISVQHGTGDSHTTAETVAAGTWCGLVVTYDDATGAATVYIQDVTSPETFTMANSPPSETVMNIMADSGGGNLHLGDVALSVEWDTCLNLAEATTVMAALNGLKAL